MLIDFKGHACANCKIMEARVWSDPGVLQRLRDNFVIIALYVDDRTQLPENEWIISELDGKKKKTIGKVNEELEIKKFKTNMFVALKLTNEEVQVEKFYQKGIPEQYLTAWGMASKDSIPAKE